MKVDYLIVGLGLAGLAFVEELIKANKSFTFNFIGDEGQKPKQTIWFHLIINESTFLKNTYFNVNHLNSGGVSVEKSFFMNDNSKPSNKFYGDGVDIIETEFKTG